MVKQDIIDTFQHEFGRLLSPIELELIDDWRKQGFKDEQIRDALKEAVFSGAVNLRYIGKILKSWKTNQQDNINSTEEQDLSWLE